MFYLTQKTKMVLACAGAVIGACVALGGVHICRLEDKDIITCVMAIYLLLDGLAVMVYSMVYIFIKLCYYGGD